MLIDLTRAAVLPALAAGVGATLKWSIEAAGARRNRLAPPVSRVILPPGVRLPPPIAPSRRVGVPGFFDLLPPVPRRTSPWKAALVGGLGFGWGIGGYFRTRTDTIAAVVLMLPVIVGIAVEPADKTPGWFFGLVYGMMAVMALYSALRAVSSNRRRERTPRRSYAERRHILRDELDALAADRWRVESAGEYEAVIASVARPNHVLHAVISSVTFGLWIPVWIVVTAAKRRNPRWSYRRLFVDHLGLVSRERIPAPADAVVNVPALAPG